MKQKNKKPNLILRMDDKSLNSHLYGVYQDFNSNNGWFEEIIVDTTNPNRWTVYFTVLGG